MKNKCALVMCGVCGDTVQFSMEKTERKSTKNAIEETNLYVMNEDRINGIDCISNVLKITVLFNCVSIRGHIHCVID